LRSLHRPLSALLANLSNNLLRLLSSPEFLNPPAPTIHAPNPNPTQAHTLALATFASELLEVFDELGLGLDSDARDDGLKSTREALLLLPHEWFIHRSLGSGQSLCCLSKHSKCLLPRAPQNLLHIQRRSARCIFPPSLSKVSCQHMCAPSHGTFLLRLCSLILPRWRFLWFGAHSWPLLRGHLHT